MKRLGLPAGSGSMLGARRTRQLRRGMYLLPSLFTVGNIFCGYVAIVRSTLGEYETAALLILVAALLDAVDGRVARFTGTSSEFGLQFDSIADVISFGVAPAMLAFHWALFSFGRVGWAVSFLFVICGALRLARFNLQKTPYDRRFFVGMPIPAAACIVATTVYAHPERPAESQDPLMGGMLVLLVLLVSLLMVSRVRYRSFKDLDLKSRKSHKYLLIPAAALALVALNPQVVLMLGGFAYLLSGILPRVRRPRSEAGTISADGIAAAHSPGRDDVR
ncbi:MAG TPA: CDP-diacylglycerol--serine O-phosphatidyltransferase [Candidatus Polarisedimenticolia bacterium]|nr:CDP-diacylglycerol--serine O-phosphatidyltransferase [Candidatus Polarisedimenticolia bacterium]